MAIELFRESQIPAPQAEPAKASWWASLFGSAAGPAGIGRRPTPALTGGEKNKLDGYYVRIRYNDEPVTVPACKLPGNHLEGDESFCTLVSTVPAMLSGLE
jgi:acid phosphatase